MSGLRRAYDPRLALRVEVAPRPSLLLVGTIFLCASLNSWASTWPLRGLG
jgi:hypothetical protein